MIQSETTTPSGILDRLALVIEADHESADLVSTLLGERGFAVLRASSAEEALKMVPQQRLDLIALDTQLPGIDGWQFLATIREDPTLATVPLVVISGTSEGPLALAGGAAAILEKPVSRAALELALTSAGFHDRQNQTRTVLVVDDDPKAVELIAAYLPIPDYVTVRAYGGQEAIVLAHRVRPDLIVLDLLMPDVTGFDVVQTLQEDPGTADIPILVVTAREITELDRKVLNADPIHAIRIIDKAGFNRTDFQAEVRHALPER
jgi:CheY-like chemotaxis protein